MIPVAFTAELVEPLCLGRATAEIPAVAQFTSWCARSVDFGGVDDFGADAEGSLLRIVRWIYARLE